MERRNILGLLCFLCAGFSSALNAADIDTVQNRLVTDTLPGVPASLTVAGWISSQQANGSWSDINYADKSQVNWLPQVHLDRLLALARAYRTSGNTYFNDVQALNAFSKGFDYWTGNRPTSYNWYKNEIGGPRVLVRAMLLMEDQLTPQQIINGRPSLGSAGTKAIGVSSGYTGQNLVWWYDIRIVRGCVENDTGLVSEGFSKIAAEIKFVSTGSDGLRPDYSFHQHGALLYSGGYGLDFAKDSSYFAAVANETSYAFAAAKIDLLTGLILDHQQWSMRGQTSDFGISGRAITRPGETHRGSSFQKIGVNMASLNTARKNEFENFAARVAGSGTSVHGNRHFYWSDFMTHQRSGYFAAVRMNSTRTITTEVVNSENLKGYYLSDGAFSIYTSGDEYFDIYPIWDWRLIPGTTTRQSTASLVPGDSVRGATSFVGGVSNGAQGVAAMDLSRDGVTAKKGWFLFDNEIVALGAGINLTTGFPVTTSVNQCFLNGAVSLSDGTTAGTGQQVLPSPNWVHHSDVGYLFPQAGNVTLKTGAQSGKWSSINLSGSTTTVTKDVFSLWFDHGTNPSNGTYQYIVVPGVSKTAFATYAAAVPVTVLSNTSSLQAVRHSELKLTGIAFYSPGSIEIRPGVTLSSDKACLVLFRELSGGAAELAVSNPLNAALTAKIDINLPMHGNNSTYDSTNGITSVTFAIPSGNESGKSIVTHLAAGPGEVETPGPTITTQLSPVADATVFGGQTSTNYGATSDLTLKEDSGSSFDRQAYLRFDLQGLTGTLSRATLRFTATSVTNDIQNMATDLRFVASDAWTETGITWSNKPTTSTVLSQFTGVNVGTPRDLDVTAQVSAELGGDKLLSLALLATTSGNRIATYASREHATAAYRPTLILEMTKPPPPVLYLPADITVGATGQGGAVVNFTATANDSVDGAITPVCAPPSGSTFPIGTTTVNCTATNSGGQSATGSFTITVLRTFASFQDQYGLDDPDPNVEIHGIPQLHMYSFGLNPEFPDYQQLPAGTLQDGCLHITYKRWKDALDLSYVVEVSEDLVNWFSGPDYTEQVSLTPIDATCEEVVMRDLIPVTDASQRFIRVRIFRLED